MNSSSTRPNMANVTGVINTNTANEDKRRGTLIGRCHLYRYKDHPMYAVFNNDNKMTIKVWKDGQTTPTHFDDLNVDADLQQATQMRVYCTGRKEAKIPKRGLERLSHRRSELR